MSSTNLFCLIVSFFFISQCKAQERYFYSGRDFGSEANFNPVNLILNGSFDIIQLDGHQRDIFNFPYAAGFRNVSRNVFSPAGPVQRYGVDNFLGDEVFPLHLTKRAAQWWPNYQLHLIGGGMTYRATTEWYDVHGFPSPALFSIGTMAAYHFLNEVVENEDYQGDNVDPISDIWIFDTGGILLFSYDNVCRWFRDELHLADWSKQASFDLRNGTLQNNGQYFTVKWKIPWQDRFHFFYYFGMNGLTGVSYKFDNGYSLSGAAGLHASQRDIVNSSTRQVSMDLVWNGGVFIDKDNSLLASLTLSGLTDDAADLNIYPGVFDIQGFSPGFWMEYRSDHQLLLGITARWTPGIGISSE